jgi:hypothetical protein
MPKPNVGAVAAAVAAVEAEAVAALPVAAAEAAETALPAVEAAAVVGSPGVVLLLPEASLAAQAVVAPASEARREQAAVARAVPPVRVASVR